MGVRWRTDAGRGARQNAAVRPGSDNLLLAGLTTAAAGGLESSAATVSLQTGQVLCEMGERIAHAYFPLGGTIAIATDEPQFLEVAVVGFEGMVGIGLVLDSPAMEFQARVQTPGRALRVECASFIRELAVQPALRVRMNRYAYVRMLQLAQDIACRNCHLLEGRLARQLLVARDRARSDRIVLTHATLAGVLGVRRAGVTLAASALQKSGLVRYSRGHIELLDVAGLRAAACSCYAADYRIYSRYLGRGRIPE
jgi:CRP-like cAMP-binding protein